MARQNARLYGTEQDRVNCPFYYKIGACTYGDTCQRLHNKPSDSLTLLIMNMYQTPFNKYGQNSQPLFNKQAGQKHFDGFYEDVFQRLAQYGLVEEIRVCRNSGDHLAGNAYVKFYDHRATKRAKEGLDGVYYDGRPLVAELSPVTNFGEAKCRQYELGDCHYGGKCNYMHLWTPSKQLRDKLEKWQIRLHRRKESIARKNEKGTRDKRNESGEEDSAEDMM